MLVALTLLTRPLSNVAAVVNYCSIPVEQHLQYGLRLGSS